MVPSPSESLSWPEQTPAPSTSYQQPRPKRTSDSLKRRRAVANSPRQTADSSQIATAMENCQVYSGNQVISCFPTADTIVPQHEYAPFVWNSNRIAVYDAETVDIYVFTGDSLQPIVNMYNQPNPRGQAGYVTAPVNDTWFGTAGAAWSGKNISKPFYWVVQPAGSALDGSEVAQATFTAVQTTYLDSVSSSLASASSASTASIASTSLAAAASSSALSSESTASTASTASVASRSGSLGSGASSGAYPSSTGAGGGVQSDTGGTNFPKWAIGVIVVLGLLAIIAAGILAFLLVRRLRRRDEESSRGSMGSASPMMANAQTASSPLLGGGAALAAGAAGAAGGAAYEHHRASSVVSPDGASSVSHGGSAGEGGPFSGADAAIMADAFRKALRKPEFAGGIDEGDSPGSGSDPNNGALMSRELADEGRDIRSVESSRGVQVESMSDSGETETAHTH